MHSIIDNVCRRRNLGRGRYIPFYNNKVYVHKTVEERIQNKENNYKPMAHNWEAVADMREWVS